MCSRAGCGIIIATSSGRYPGAADSCDAECGRIFERFWDECGKMLHGMHMGGTAAG
jgi:hypothetical protein